MGCNSAKHPLLLERAGVRRIKYLNPPIPAFFLKGEEASTCVDTYALSVGGDTFASRVAR